MHDLFYSRYGYKTDQSASVLREESATTTIAARACFAAGSIVLGLAFATDMAAAANCDVDNATQQCCSAKKCGGKVLNNRDQHNCTNSGGKSWHAGAHGGQPAACVAL